MNVASVWANVGQKVRKEHAAKVAKGQRAKGKVWIRAARLIKRLQRAKRLQGMQGTKARRGQTLQPHKMNMRMNIHTYTH